MSDLNVGPRGTDPGYDARPAPDIIIIPLVVKPRAACQMLSCGLTRLYELLAAGDLASYTDGRSRLITTDSIRAYVARKVTTGAPQ